MHGPVGRSPSGGGAAVRRGWLPLALALGAMGFFAQPAHADQLDVAKRLYHELDYDSARVALLRAAASPDSNRRAEAYLYLGLIDTVEGDDDAARESFRSALVLEPGLDLPLGTSPKVARIFNAVRSELAADSSRPPPMPLAAPGRRTRAPPPVAVPPPAAPPSAPLLAAPARSLMASPDGEAARSADATGQGPGAEPTSELKAAAPGSSHAGAWIAATGLVGGLAAAAGGAYFGTQEQASERAFAADHFQSNAVNDKAAAGRNATTANILYAAAGLLALTGVTIWLAW